jgi:hypothetical protein
MTAESWKDVGPSRRLVLMSKILEDAHTGYLIAPAPSL